MTNMGKTTTDAWAAVQLAQHLDRAAEVRSEAARQRRATAALDLAGATRMSDGSRMSPESTTPVTSRPVASDAGPRVAIAAPGATSDRSSGSGREVTGAACCDRPAPGQAA